MIDELKDVINLMKKTEVCDIAAFLTVEMMKEMDYVQVDVPVFNFESNRAYEEFYIEDDDEHQSVWRSAHKTYCAKMEWLPTDNSIIGKIFSHCVRSELQLCDLEDPILIIRSKPSINATGVFMTRFCFIDKSWMSGAIRPFSMWFDAEGMGAEYD